MDPWRSTGRTRTSRRERSSSGACRLRPALRAIGLWWNEVAREKARGATIIDAMQFTPLDGSNGRHNHPAIGVSEASNAGMER